MFAKGIFHKNSKWPSQTGFIDKRNAKNTLEGKY